MAIWILKSSQLKVAKTGYKWNIIRRQNVESQAKQATVTISKFAAVGEKQANKQKICSQFLVDHLVWVQWRFS